MAGTIGSRVLTSPDHRALFNSALLIGLLTIAVKAVTLIRDMIVASRFGTSDANDAYIVGWVLPGFLVGVVAGGFSGAVIPIQIETREKSGRRREQALLGEVMLVSIAAYLLATAVLLFGNRALMPLVAQGYSENKFALAAQLSTVMLPAVLIGGIASLWSSILNAENKFGLVAVAPVAVPAVSAVILLANPSAGIEWIAAGFVIGTAVQAAVLYLGLQREGISLSLGWHGLMPETRALLKQCLVLCANGAVFGGVGVVDSAMAATLGPGSQSTLGYANKLIVPFLGISSTAIGTAVLPYFSRLVATEDWEGLRHTLRTYTRLILAVAIPTTMLLIVLSRPLVSLLFERGEFTAEDTNAVARVLATYSLLIPIETVALLMSRVLVSMQIGRVMVAASVGIFIANIVADYVLKGFLGIEGIALATVLNQTLSLIFLIFMWRHIQRTRIDVR
ncbi:MAG: oligosaccharide flippase family protein [Thermomicrobiales bacterium]|nr:oligosaccharide flippase family protein [Thermomicrobiales bacterium]